jgi:hypothetical protein
LGVDRQRASKIHSSVFRGKGYQLECRDGENAKNGSVLKIISSQADRQLRWLMV